MATTRKATHSENSNSTDSKVSAQSSRIKNATRNATSIVRDAAEILDEEVASGIVAARQVQQRFRKSRTIDPKDFETALQKFNTDAHELLTLVGNQVDEMGSKQNSELTRKLMGRTHDVLDLAVEMINIGAELANEVLQTTKKPTKAPRARSAK